MITGSYQIAWEAGAEWSETCVVIPLYNYAGLVGQTLESLLPQTLDNISLVIVDDCSKDNSLAVAEEWLHLYRDRFEKAVIATHDVNSGLAITRNTGVSITSSRYCFFLDADNLLYPKCLQRHAEVLAKRRDAVACYALIESFGGEGALMGGEAFSRDRLKYGPYIDAMAMIRREHLLACGGFMNIRFGWEDYDMWLKMCEADEIAVHIPEILSRYRVHGSSMLRSLTNVNNNHRILRNNMQNLHPWLELS